MNKELEEQLFALAPEFFNREDRQRSLMCFGFECGDGWYNIIRTLIETAKAEAKSWDEDRQCVAEWQVEAQSPDPEVSARAQRALANNQWRIEKVASGRNPFENFNIVQVKEKFGGLRFYYYGGDERFAAAADFASTLSYRTCESCGAKAEQTRDSGWIRTECAPCQKVRLKAMRRRNRKVALWAFRRRIYRRLFQCRNEFHWQQAHEMWRCTKTLVHRGDCGFKET